MTTGYVYHSLFLEHDKPGHPENARRLVHTLDVLKQSGVLDRLLPVEPRPATVEELETVHTAAHVERVREVAERGGGHLDPDTYVCPRSYEAACMAAGGLLAAVEALLAGEIDNGFALLRPPGHHATPTRGMGFCLFNNVALAARHALREPGIERVFIADFDVHHGNGTQDAFERDPRVFYFSTHEYPFYPGTGHWSEIGEGEGRGTVLDVPLSAGVGDEGYAAVFTDLAWPLAHRFRPDLILVSAGYDAHWSDPLAQMNLSLAGYAGLGRELVRMAEQLCEGRIVFTLEGGYELDVLAYGVLNAFRAMTGEDTVADPIGPSPRPERPVDALIARLKQVHGLN